MDKTKKMTGKTEKKCARILRDFIFDYGQNPTLIASGIRDAQNVKFSPHTIGRWLNEEQTITLEKWGQIEKYIESVTNK